ncbi:MAG: FAD-dependent oxidoreductase, partial [Microthrixaceae bacterium]|nr:FAD-dependent oxidoreductase [Microthrixaceae bacterium]
GGAVADEFDAVVVGSGPNGLVAALELAQTGWRVLVLERSDTLGGGARTAELTLPGFRHDVCSAIHPLGLASPALRDLGLEKVGVEWVQPDAPLAHALRPGHSVLQERSLAATAVGLGVDGRPWERLFGPSVGSGLDLVDSLLDPLDLPPRHPVQLARYGMSGLWSVSALARRRFRGDDGPALLAGLAGHSMLSLDAPITTGFGMLLGQLAHVVGWPMARGGSQAIADGLVALIRALGGTVLTGEEVRSLDDLPPARAVICDVTPRQLIDIAGDRLPSAYRRRLERYRYGPGVFKVDWALDGPVPWIDPRTARAGTVHLGGTLAEVRASEEDVVSGRVPQVPFLLLAQQSNFDPDRAPRVGTPPGPTATSPTAPPSTPWTRSSPTSSASPPAFARPSSAAGSATPPRWSATTPTTSAATSTAASPISGNCSSARSPASTPTRPRPATSSSARRRRRPGAGCTACADGPPPDRCCAANPSDPRLPQHPPQPVL